MYHAEVIIIIHPTQFINQSAATSELELEMPMYTMRLLSNITLLAHRHDLEDLVRRELRRQGLRRNEGTN
jgi:hypothetical protein